MNINSAILSFSLLNEVDCIIKYAFYVFYWMIFQMILFVSECVLMVVFTVISRAIDYMRDVVFQECWLILSKKIWSQVHKLINDLWTDSLEFIVSSFSDWCVGESQIINTVRFSLNFFNFTFLFLINFSIMNFLNSFQIENVHF